MLHWKAIKRPTLNSNMERGLKSFNKYIRALTLKYIMGHIHSIFLELFATDMSTVSAKKTCMDTWTGLITFIESMMCMHVFIHQNFQSTRVK